MLELVLERPDWLNALGVALTRPPGVPERRQGQDPWKPDRHRSARGASPTTWPGCGRRSTSPRRTACARCQGTSAVGAWEPEPASTERLKRLSERRVLDAAGFLLHDDEPAIL